MYFSSVEIRIGETEHDIGRFLEFCWRSLPDFGGDFFLFPPFIFIVAMCSLVKTCCNCLFIAENKIIFIILSYFHFHRTNAMGIYT